MTLIIRWYPSSISDTTIYLQNFIFYICTLENSFCKMASNKVFSASEFDYSLLCIEYVEPTKAQHLRQQLSRFICCIVVIVVCLTTYPIILLGLVLLQLLLTPVFFADFALFKETLHCVRYSNSADWNPREHKNCNCVQLEKDLWRLQIVSRSICV